MSALRVLLADDEPPARRRLRDLLASEPDVVVAAESVDGPDTVRALLEHELDAVFLDVQMPGLDGFEVLRAVGAEAMPAVVFVTAYDQHALRAFEVSAVDYLLKPFDRRRFAAALARLRLRARDARDRGRLAELERAAGGARPPELLAARAGGRAAFVRPDEVDWLRAAGNYVRLHAGGRELLARGTLAGMLERLAPVGLVRIHRSVAVNPGRVAEVAPLEGGDLEVRLRDGTRLRASRRYRAALDARLG